MENFYCLLSVAINYGLYFQLFIQLRNNKEICPKEDKSNLLNQLFYSHSMVPMGLGVRS